MKTPIKQTFRLSSLSLFMPCYNEEKNVEASVVAALDVLPRIANKYEIIIVNDGSKDKTGKLAQNLSKVHKEIKVISHSENKGYGAALKSGFANSQHEWVFFTDGDLQFNLNQLESFLPFTKSHSVVIGFRPKRAEGKKREINARFFKYFVDVLYRLHVKDIDCAFKLFHKNALEKVDLKCDGAFINAELLYKLKKKGYKFKQLPVTHFPRKHGKPTGNNFKVVIKAGKEAIIFYLNLKFGLPITTQASNVKN